MEKINGIVGRVVGEAKQKTKEVKTGLMIKQERGEKVAVEQNVLDASIIFNTTEEERKRGVVERWVDKEKTKYMKLFARVEGELVKVEDLNLFLGCFLLLKHARVKVNKYTVETNYSQIVELLLLTDAGINYENIKEGLNRLVTNSVETNFWFDTISGERIVKSEFHFLDRVDKGEVEKLRIRINPEIVDSMEKGYLKVLEEKKLIKMLRLKGYAKVLALLFAKKIGIDQEKTYTISYSLELLGLKEKYEEYNERERNDYLKRVIIPAVSQAADVLGYTIRIFVPNYRGEEIMVYPQRQKSKHYDLISGKVVFEKKQLELFGNA